MVLPFNLARSHFLCFSDTDGKPYTVPVCRCEEPRGVVYRTERPLITGVIVAVEGEGIISVTLPGSCSPAQLMEGPAGGSAPAAEFP